MSRRHYNYLTEPQFGRSKRIKVWKNGDPYNNCYEFLINPKVLRTWNCVLKYITDVIHPEFGAVRRLVSLTSKRSICCFDDLNPSDKYVAVGLNGLKIIKSGYKTPSEMALKNKSKKKAYYVGEFYQPKFKFLQLTKRKGLTIIYLVVNKKVCQVPMKIVLNERDFSNWEVILRYIDKMLDIPTGIQSICTIFGDVIDDPHSLQHGYVYVAVPCDEKFVSIDYMALFQNFFHPITSYTVSIKPAKGARVIQDPFETGKIEKKKLELPFAQYDLESTRDMGGDISSYQCGCHCQNKSPKKTVSHPIAGRFPFPRRTKLKKNYSKQMPPIQEDPKESYAPSLCEDDDDDDDEAEAVVNFQTETLWKQFLTTAHSSAENSVIVFNTNSQCSTGANDKAVTSPRKSSIRASKEYTSSKYLSGTEERKKSSLKQVGHQLGKEGEALTRSSPNSTDDSNSLRKNSMKECSCEDACTPLKKCSSKKCRSGNTDELSRKSLNKSSSELYKEEVHSSTRSSLSNANDRNSSRKSSLKKGSSDFRPEANELTSSSLSKADDQRSLEKSSPEFDAPRTLSNVNNCNSLRSSLEKKRSKSTPRTSKRSSDISAKRSYSPIRMESIIESILEHIAASTDEQQTISSNKSSLKYFERRSSLKNDILKQLETENEENLYVDIWTIPEDDVEDKPPFTQSQFATDAIQPTSDRCSILKKPDNDVVEAETITSISDIRVQNENNPSTVLRVDSVCRPCSHQSQQEKTVTCNLGRDQVMTISENAGWPELNTTNTHIGSQCCNTSKPLVVKKKSERVSISSQTDTSTLQPKQHNTNYGIKLKSGSALGFDITPLLQALPSNNKSSNVLNSSNKITKTSANKLENTEQEKGIESFSNINGDPRLDDKCSIMSEDSIDGNY